MYFKVINWGEVVSALWFPVLPWVSSSLAGVVSVVRLLFGLSLALMSWSPDVTSMNFQPDVSALFFEDIYAPPHRSDFISGGEGLAGAVTFSIIGPLQKLHRRSLDVLSALPEGTFVICLSLDPGIQTSNFTPPPSVFWPAVMLSPLLVAGLVWLISSSKQSDHTQ